MQTSNEKIIRLEMKQVDFEQHLREVRTELKEIKNKFNVMENQTNNILYEIMRIFIGWFEK